MLSGDLTYSMLHEMVMQKFNLEANAVINLSFKLSSFDFAVDITDDSESRDKYFTFYFPYINDAIIYNRNLSLTHTHFFSPLTYYMAYGENEARQAIVLKLQREIQAEETLAHQLLCNLTGYTEEMHIRSLQITRLQTMPTTSRNTYGLHALLMTLEADIRTTNTILRTRQQLLRNISAKQNFVNNYTAI
nr:hypothetical protein [Tanacetum cinerariifolium]